MYSWKVDDNYTNYSFLHKDISNDILGDDFGDRTMKLAIRGLVNGNNIAYLVTSDGSFWDFL